MRTQLLRQITLCGLLFSLTVPLASNAEVTVEEYERLRPDTREFDDFKRYLSGVATGMDWASATLATEGRTELFCPPSRLALNVDNHLRILNDQVCVLRQSNSSVGSFHVEPLLLRGLRATFPCRPSSTRSK